MRNALPASRHPITALTRRYRACARRWLAGSVLFGTALAAQAAPPIFVLNSQDADISIIDPATYTVLRRVPTGKEPHHLYLAPDEKTLIVASATGNTLTFIDASDGKLLRTVRDIADPYHLRFSPDMKWFVTAANRLNHVNIYRWQGAGAEQPFVLVKRIEAPKTPSHLNIDSRSSVVYASLQGSDELLAIDLATQLPRWKIKVGKMPADLYLTADDRTLLVGLTGDRFVEAWDVSGAQPRLVKRMSTGEGAHAFRARGDKRHVFVSNRVANTISLIDTQTLSVVAEYPAPGGPDCMDLGIWSRQDAWAPAVLEPLITGLQARGLCFTTLREHPQYRAAALAPR